MLEATKRNSVEKGKMTLVDAPLTEARAGLPWLGPPNTSCSHQKVRNKVQKRSFKDLG